MVSDDRVVVSSGMTFHLRSHGPVNGKPVLFLHGVLSADPKIAAGARTHPTEDQERKMRASVTCPTLVARAEHSEVFIGDGYMRVADEYAHGSHHMLRGTGHMLMWEGVDDTVAVLNDFLG